MTTPVSNSLPIDYSTPATTTASTSNALDPQAFLQLLVAQLKYQDPSSPMDTSAFMNQTATLSQVQTMDSMSTAITSLVSAQQTQQATSMIGNRITYLDATGNPADGVVNGISLAGGTPTLKVGEVTVALADVTEVNAATP